MIDEKQPFVSPFNEAIANAEVYLCITRDSGCQRDCIQTISQLRSQAADPKVCAIKDQSESVANLLLGYECVFSALLAELEMWVLLKAENPDSAWDKLVAAQTAIVGALRAHAAFSHLGTKLEHLEEIERIVFPPQVFTSSGMIVKRQECSICGHDYEECEHLAGKPYWGEFCSIVVQDCELDHIAIVSDPADKRCRVMRFSAEGGTRNRMTWLVEPDEECDPRSGRGS